MASIVILMKVIFIKFIILICFEKSMQNLIDKNIEIQNPDPILIGGNFYNSFSNKFKIIGRLEKDLQNNITLFDWPGSSVIFEIIGTCDEIYLDLKSQNDYFSVYYNDVFKFKINSSSLGLIKIKPAEKNLKIELTKATEPLMSNDYVRFKGIYLVGKCELKENPRGKAKLIEYIGDSITCGFGVEQLRNKTITLDTSSIVTAYPGILAKKLDADYYAICASGMGVTHSSGYNGVGLVSQYYNRNYFHSNNITTSITTNPDYIIICLGTNDWFYIKKYYYETQMIDKFVDYFKLFLIQVRFLNPIKNGIIPPIVVLGLGTSTAAVASSKKEMEEISTKMNPWIKNAVNLAAGKDREIYYLEVSATPFIDYNDDRDFGAGNHWSVRGSEKFANGVYSNLLNFTSIFDGTPQNQLQKNYFFIRCDYFVLIIFIIIILF
jgi:lysophospholipase L1-like esterase